MYGPITARWHDTIQAQAQGDHVSALSLLNSLSDQCVRFTIEKLFSEHSRGIASARRTPSGIAAVTLRKGTPSLFRCCSISRHPSGCFNFNVAKNIPNPISAKHITHFCHLSRGGVAMRKEPATQFLHLARVFAATPVASALMRLSPGQRDAPPWIFRLIQNPDEVRRFIKRDAASVKVIFYV